MGVKFTLRAFVAGMIFGVLAVVVACIVPGVLQQLGYPEPVHGFWAPLIVAFGISVIVTLLTADLGYAAGTLFGIIVALWIMQKMSKKEKEDGER